ncbi:MAG: TIM barrel protein [Armatimonadetes bacterium]|nr:TIM barrel protein [Armatimonadota bacterium]
MPTWALAPILWALIAQPAAKEPTMNAPGFHLATNIYSWSVFYGREGRDFSADLDKGLADIVASGLDGLETIAETPEDVDRIGAALKKHKLGMRSLYVNSTLHIADDADKSIARITAIAARAKAYGTRIIVTNPNPIQWGGTQDKDDAQLTIQSAAMNRLGKALKELGMTLAYHNHDPEMRASAREFHHMMAGTDPALVKLCLDAHWIYRGAGNSQVALFDIVKLYGARVAELHLRQSRGGVWAEDFGEGDLDYPRLAEALRALKLRPHVVLEQAVEAGTPKTLSPVDAHRRSAAYARPLLEGIGAR